MLKKRIVGVLIVKEGIVVQSIGFKRYLPVGKPEIAVEYLNKWGIDEIVLLDMDATRENRGPDFAMIKRVSEKCFVPLTVGGGINSLECMKKVIRYGADKISINTAAIKNPQLIKEGSDVLGNQCIVVSMDVKRNGDRRFEVFSDSGTIPTSISALEMAKTAESLGAGEILLNSVNRDGSKTGYELELIKEVASMVSIPVIACGGVGHPKHFLEGFKNSKICAAAAGNYFHFTEHTPIFTKAFLKNYGVDIRLETYATYKDFKFDDDGRILKRSDQYYDKLRFEYIPEEII
ncbi:MAG: imidazole glycerol phosphate synthase cyclase subunit [Nanoarchaeota archaeon]|nr:imidazole glycerol phosphate synthase cyclase subunit [Nanoarchaeota archaeon]